MRIVGGTHRGRKLATLSGLVTRPTADFVKEALFNILAPYMTDAVVLDLFAGSGALGLEALSRGARTVTFVERDRRALAVIRKNAERLQLLDKSLIVAADALKAAARFASDEQRFDLIFADPPYERELAVAIAESLDKHNLLTKDGLIVIEHHRQEELPSLFENIRQIRVSRYGDTVLTFFGPKRGET